MDDITPNRLLARQGEILPPDASANEAAAALPVSTQAGGAALTAAPARKATSAATLRAYKADWAHFAD